MNWRMKLADWISGGELSRLREAAKRLEEMNAVVLSKWRSDIDDMGGNLSACRDKLFVMGIAMQKIANMETPRANATVRRMANVAREALK